jgi:hypothetical protein
LTIPGESPSYPCFCVKTNNYFDLFKTVKNSGSMKKNLQIGKKIALALILLVTAAVTNAATKTATANGNWSTPGTWIGGVPAAGDDVIIPAGITVTLNVNTANIATLSVSGTLSIGDNTARIITVTGTVTVNASGVITIANFNDTHTFNIGGNLSNAGTFDMNTGSNDLCNVVFNGAANQTVSGSGANTEFNNITINNTGATNNVNNIVDFTASNLVFPIDFLTLTDGTFKLSAPETLDLSGNNLNLTAPDGFVVNNASAIVNIGNNDITIAGGIFQILTGTVNVGTGNDLFGVTSGSATISGGTLNILGQMQLTGGTTTINGGSIVIDPQVGVAILGPTLNIFEAAAAAIVTFSSGSVTIVDPHAATGTGNSIQVTSGAGAKNFTGSTFNLGNGVSTTTGSADGFDINTGGVSLGSLTVNNPSGTNRAVRYLTNAPTFSGTVTITAGTLNANSLNQTVAGNWVNNGTFTPGTQTTTFNGSSLQTVSGAATAFSSLTINNTGAGVSLTKDVSVAGTLTLTDGVVASAPTPNGLLTLNAGGTLSGGSVASHISGPMARTGGTNFTFPVGNGTIYRPIAVSSLSASATITGRYFLANPRAAFGINGTGPSQAIKDISLCEYWDLDDGSSTITGIVGLQYSSTSPCNSGGYITDPSKLVVAHFNGTSWDNLSAVPGATLTNMTALTSSSFSPFTIGTTDAGLNGLPVTFTDVKAAEKGTAVQIDWTNSTESDMGTYVIERSANGIDFTAIGQTAPRSNQFDRVSYTYLDAVPLAGTNFYRIKAVEITGKNVYSRSLRVDIGRSPKGISLYPNPVKGTEIIIGFSASKGQYSLNVVNTAGQLVFKQQVNHAGGTVAQTVSLPASLKSGVYNLLISGDNYKETKMFVIQ